MPDPPRIDYEEVYRLADEQGVPWDIGIPQPALAELIESGWCTGRVLDSGCGTAEAGLALAARGHAVTGIDLSATAIARARAKADERGLELDLRVADVTRPQPYEEVFDTILDSGLLHCLQPEDQRRYLDVLRRMCRPGGRIAVLCFADAPGARTPDSGRLGEPWLRELFSDGWRIEAFEPADILAVVREDFGDSASWPRDSAGRLLMTGWLLRARRI